MVQLFFRILKVYAIEDKFIKNKRIKTNSFNKKPKIHLTKQANLLIDLKRK